VIPSFGAPLPNGRSAYIAPLGLWEKATADEVTAWERQDPWLTLGYNEGWLARYLAHSDPGSTRYLLRLDGRPAGLVGVRSPWLLGPFLELLLVAPEAQGAGLGRFALNALVRAAEGRFPNLWTSAADFNARARALYESAGFVAVAPIPGLLAPGRDEILYRRTR
jgi:GNAT superfamily N-acetyltransferase